MTKKQNNPWSSWKKNQLMICKLTQFGSRINSKAPYKVAGNRKPDFIYLGEFGNKLRFKEGVTGVKFEVAVERASDFAPATFGFAGAPQNLEYIVIRQRKGEKGTGTARIRILGLNAKNPVGTYTWATHHLWVPAEAFK